MSAGKHHNGTQLAPGRVAGDHTVVIEHEADCSMDKEARTRQIVAVVLAAGKSERFGRTKLLAELNGKPLVQYALAAAQEACPGRVCLVVGHDAEHVVTAASGVHDTVVVNASYASGMGSSIAAGVRDCAVDADAILLLLADQPLITGDYLRQLTRTWSGSDSEIVASSFDTVRSPPILFPRKTFEALQNLSGDEGARSILASAEFTVSLVNCEDARFDIDRLADLAFFDRN